MRRGVWCNGVEQLWVVRQSLPHQRLEPFPRGQTLLRILEQVWISSPVRNFDFFAIFQTLD